MSDKLEKLQHQLVVAQRALAESEARYVRQEVEHKSAIEKAEKTRKQIIQAHQQWMSVVDTAEDPIFIHDREFRVLRCNRAYQQHAGIPYKQIIGQPYYEIFPKTHAPLSSCLQVLEKAEAEAEEEILVGETTYRSRAYSIRDEQGVYLYSVHTLENLNKSKRISGEPQEFELRYRWLLEAAPGGILILDAETNKIVDANPFILKMLSYNIDECIYKTLWEIGLFKDVDASKAAFEELQSSGYVRFEDFPLETKDGRRLDVEFICHLYAVGERKVIQCNIRDITERKQVVNERNRATNLLDERLKELGCLYAVLSTTADSQLSLEQCMQHIVEIIPSAFQYPEITCARISLRGRQYRNRDLKRTTWSLASPIVLAGEDDGELEVFYTQERPASDEGPFLREEQDLVDTVAGIVGDYLRLQLAMSQLQQFRDLLDDSNDSVFVVDPGTARILDVNRRSSISLGYSRDELLNLKVMDIEAVIPGKSAWDRHVKAVKKAGAMLIEGEHRRKDGNTFPVEVSIKHVTREGSDYLVAVVRDITERKQTEQILHDEETFSETLVQGLPDIFYFLDSQGSMLRWNKQSEVLFGLSAEELLGINALALIHEDDRPRAAKSIQQVFETGSSSVEARLVMAKGPRDYLLTGTRIETTLGINLIGIGIDITERKRAEERQNLFRALLDQSSDSIEVIEPETFRFLDINDTACRSLGYSREELLSMSVSDIDPAFDEAAQKALNKALKKTARAKFDGVHQRKDGSTFPVEVSTTRIQLDKPYLLTIARDATERKKAEAILDRTNRALRVLSACNMALVQASTEDELLHGVVDAIVKMSGYNQAVVDFVGDDLEKSITPIAWASMEEEPHWAQGMSWGDTKYGQLPVSKAVRSGATQICHDIANKPEFEPWRDEVLAFGYVSNIALPLVEDGKVFGVLSIYSSDEEAFNDVEEIGLLGELAGDLAYGIGALRTRAQHEQATVILRQSLEQSIQTIAAIVESRDPYTAGHQRRVSELATAIAREMELPEEQVNGIHLAAIIHDLGKIHIPAEILSKPGKLTDVEFMLIKTHPQAGYDILKDVIFPWPIADVVLQHHERLDGNGYPQGLKGEGILLEARIIAVADVVEAMSSHRPYRAGLGIEVALGEIKRGRSSAYDPVVVDACLTLFAEKKFAFSDPSS